MYNNNTEDNRIVACLTKEGQASARQQYGEITGVAPDHLGFIDLGQIFARLERRAEEVHLDGRFKAVEVEIGSAHTLSRVPEFISTSTADFYFRPANGQAPADNSQPIPQETRMEHIPNSQYEVWIGGLGYDTRPYIQTGEHLPVAYDVGYADGRPGYSVPAGDVAGFLAALPEGSVVIEPDFMGSTLVGHTRWVKNAFGWVSEYKGEEQDAA